MHRRTVRLTLALAAALAAGSALAAPASTGASKAPAKGGQCFFSRDWNGWRAPDDRTIIIRVGLHDYYKLGLSNRCPELRDPAAHIINIMRGSSTICGPLDLDLKVSTGQGFATPCLVKSMSKMTPEEVKATPKKDLP
jgi:hypothetical protein